MFAHTICRIGIPDANTNLYGPTRSGSVPDKAPIKYVQIFPACREHLRLGPKNRLCLMCMQKGFIFKSNLY